MNKKYIQNCGVKRVDGKSVPDSRLLAKNTKLKPKTGEPRQPASVLGGPEDSSKIEKTQRALAEAKWCINKIEQVRQCSCNNITVKQ